MKDDIEKKYNLEDLLFSFSKYLENNYYFDIYDDIYDDIEEFLKQYRYEQLNKIFKD